jgi:hypothetical protein
LLDKEVIFKDDLSNILGKRPFDKDKNPEKSGDNKEIEVAVK